MRGASVPVTPAVVATGLAPATPPVVARSPRGAARGGAGQPCQGVGHSENREILEHKGKEDEGHGKPPGTGGGLGAQPGSQTARRAHLRAAALAAGRARYGVFLNGGGADFDDPIVDVTEAVEDQVQSIADLGDLVLWLQGLPERVWLGLEDACGDRDETEPRARTPPASAARSEG